MNVAALREDWIWPYWLAQQRSDGAVATADNDTARNWTTLANLASDRKAIVDQRGLVSTCPSHWSLDWWVGADDRWHFPSRDAGVRQRLVDDTPVVETAMRVPGGDAVHRAYVVRPPSGYGADELLVIEIENRTSLPFAIAFAARPYSPMGPGGIRQIEVSGPSVAIDGRPALWLPGPPRRAAGSTFEGGDSAAVVERGQAGDALPQPLRCRRGMAQAAFLYPMAHRAIVRVAMPLDPLSPRTRRRGGNLAALPSAESVARGWQAQSRRGMRLELPAGRLASAVAANRRYLMLMPSGRSAASVVVALDRYGLHIEAEEVLGAWAGERRVDDDANMTFLWALAQHSRLTGDADIVKRYAPVVDNCVRRLRRSRRARRLGADAGHGLAIDTVGWLEACSAPQPAVELEATDHRTLDRLRWLLDAATPTWTWRGHDGAVVAEFCSLVRNLLVLEVPGGLALLTLMPDEWLGLPIEVHDAPTHAGLLSYAIRWHGERPALLWELHRREGSGPVRLTIPGLDRQWSSDQPAGETLLAPADRTVAGEGSVS